MYGLEIFSRSLELVRINYKRAQAKETVLLTFGIDNLQVTYKTDAPSSEQ
jgi:hypothetical protein